jgi:hypothetical protein
MKLNRKQIREGLEQTPIEAVVLGAVNNSGIKLTAKQKRFAEELARGETKAGAYRKAYQSKGNSETQAKRGYELAQRQDVIGYSESIKAALEAQRFATPAHLRALTIHELTKGATDPEMPPAQRVKCLELLGKITEVALFTERREVVKVSDASQVRAALLDSIKAAIKSGASDVDYQDADDLLREIEAARVIDADNDEGGEGIDEAGDATPPHPHPPNVSDDAATPLHSNPHNGSGPFSDQISPSTQPNVFSPDGSEETGERVL